MTVTILRVVSDCTARGVRIGAVWARTLLWKLCNASCWDGCRVSGVSWYYHDGDAYISLETVLLIRDSVNFATNVDCLCALFHTFAMRISLLHLTYSVFSRIINIQKSPLFTFFELTCRKKHSVPFYGYRLHISFLLPITPTMSTLATWCRDVHSRDVHPCNLVPQCPLPRFQRPR